MSLRMRLGMGRFSALLACAGLGAAALPGCGVLFGPSGPSTVAQGNYYSSGNAQYDEFFIALYQLQVEMADAPRVPEAERHRLAQALALSPETPPDAIGQRLRDEAQKLSRSGLRMRLEQSPSLGKPEAASATLRASFRPKDNATVTLFSNLETASTNLLRSVEQMKQAENQLAKLGVAEINLDADVGKVFSQGRISKRAEVRQNLADAQKLVTLMKERAEDVRGQSDQLLSAVAQAVNTDDGSLNPPPSEAAKPQPEPSKTADADSKKAPPKARPKPKAASAPSTPAAAPAAHPKPAPAPPSGSADAPAKPSAPSKPAPPPRDFEP